MRAQHLRAPAALLTAGLVLTLALAGCTSDDQPDSDTTPASAPTSGGTASEGDGTRGERDDNTDSSSYDQALSEPVEDSVYPDIGDPSVDALHYDLDLTWDPDASVLTGVETLTFRSTGTAEQFQLDFSEALEPTSVTLDGEDADFDHDGKNLVVHEPVEEDGRYALVVEYAGTPKPAAAPTTRSDFSTTGWTITPDGDTWTMQEPYGAYTWYAVNDQPSDKAFYDFTIHTPSPQIGVANGVLEKRTDADGTTTAEWHLSSPASSYLVTVAIGDYTPTEDVSGSGVPITYWVPTSDQQLVRGLRKLSPGLDWLEAKLGPYPFDSLGVVLVDSQSGMETQTMITLGKTDYTTSAAVLVHEAAHQWYGDEVTPNDWRDVWMNEGMAMYLQGLYQADEDGVSVDSVMNDWATFEPRLRRESGPPADYDPAAFGESNIYYGPALMWHELRQRIGDAAFFDLIRTWPSVDADGSASRDDFLPWIEQQTGLELTSFFDSWLLGATSPTRD